MIEETLKKWAEVGRRSGRKGWVLVKDGRVVGVYAEKREAVAVAREPGIYLLMVVD
ncbi:MAG: hypothetical protein ACK4M3_04075 [Pyrobaculum sp.]